jgi:hypothetical protein
VKNDSKYLQSIFYPNSVNLSSPVPLSSRLFVPAFVATILLTWGLLAPRLVPNLSYDRGIFVSVAERMLAGDTL